MINSVFRMSLIEAATTPQEKIYQLHVIGRDTEEKYYTHLQAEAALLLEQEEKPHSNKLSKRVKRNQKKAEERKREQALGNQKETVVEMNPEETEPKKSHVDSNAYKIREQENLITPTLSTESQSSSEMFVEYFVPRKYSEKSAHTSPCSHQDHISAPNTPPH